MGDNGESTGSDVVALAADMMFGSRIRGAGAAAGREIAMVSRAEALVERVRTLRPRLLFVDMDARTGDPAAAIAQVRSAHGEAAPRVIAFVSHVDSDAIEAAREAGADQVLARSAFMRELPQLLDQGPAGDAGEGR